MNKKIINSQIKPLNLKKSYQMYDEANQVSPGGDLLGIRRPTRATSGEYPVYLVKTLGGMHCVDIDGNEYIDYQCGWGPIIMSYVEEEINNAVIERLNKGFCFSLPQQEKLKLEKKLTEIIPCCEKVLLSKSGSDATQIAVKLARAYTGKNKVISLGFHGWHDWSNYERSSEKSIPKQVGELTIVVPATRWGDLGYIEQILYNDKDIALIFVTPISHELSMPVEGSVEYLQGLRKLADKYNVVLAFDEVRTGFRMALGGAQECYHVTPDLGCFAKAMGNGYAISAVCGKKDIMNMAIDNTFLSSTYYNNSIDIVATLKLIEIMERDNVIGNIHDKGSYLKNNCDKITSKYNNAKAYYATDPTLSYFPLILFKGDKLQEKTDYFFTYLVRKGILLHPSHHGYIAFRHTKKDLDYTLKVFDEALNYLDKQYS